MKDEKLTIGSQTPDHSSPMESLDLRVLSLVGLEEFDDFPHRVLVDRCDCSVGVDEDFVGEGMGEEVEISKVTVDSEESVSIRLLRRVVLHERAEEEKHDPSKITRSRKD